MGGGGAPPPPPAQQQVSQTSEFPEELKRAIEENPHYSAPDDLLSDWS